MNIQKDSQPFGLLIGFLAPLIVGFSVYFYNHDAYSRFMEYPGMRTEILTKLFTIGLIPNLLIFYGFTRYDALKSARGIVLTTFIYLFILLGVVYL